MTNGSSDELRAAVAALAQDTPYQMIPTATGFVLRIDVIDAKWGGLLRDSGIKDVVENQVVLDETQRTMTITDMHLDVLSGAGFTSQGGEVRLMPSALDEPYFKKRSGRIHEVSFSFTVGLKEGQSPAVPDFTFDSEEAHQMIRVPAAELGWTEKAGTAERIGRAAAIMVVVLLVVAGLGTLAFLATTGNL